MKVNKFSKALEAAKAILLGEVPEVEATEKTTLTAKDGKVYQVAKLEVGEVVEVKEGETFAPAPDGDIELEDGSIVSVKEGKVAEVKAPEQLAENENPEAVTAPTVEEFTALTERVASLEAQLTEVLADREAFKTKDADTKKTFKAMFDLIEELANESEEKPTGTTKPSAFKATNTAKDAARAQIKAAMTA